MDAIGNSTAMTTIANQSLSNLSKNQVVEELEANSVSSILSKNDAVSSSVNSGSVPANRVSIGTRLANTSSAIATGTVNVTREAGRVITQEVLPTPEPLSVRLMRNKFLSAILVGGFVNGVTTLLKVNDGKYTVDQAKHEVVKNTAMGAVSGLSFASGMGLTASVLGKAVGGVPLSLAALTVGTVASYFSTELLKNQVNYFKDNPVA
ncbi:MAG: hypothetical protein U0457_04075 [Candidatus Sericytochromatia bacterium]